MRIDVVTLVSDTVPKDNAGFPTGRSETERSVVATVSDVARAEFFAAKQAGENATLSVELSPLDYSDEQYLRFNGKKYRIIRKYKVPDKMDTLLLTCEEVL